MARQELLQQLNCMHRSTERQKSFLPKGKGMKENKQTPTCFNHDNPRASDSQRSEMVQSISIYPALLQHTSSVLCLLGCCVIDVFFKSCLSL